MTNKTFLTILLLGVSYTAYNAAAVSENFEISTTIDHEIVLGNFKAVSADAGLDVTRDLDLGTITINPTYIGDAAWEYDTAGNFSRYYEQGGVISVGNATKGRFIANIPNPSACNGYSYDCGGLSFESSSIYHIFGGNDDNDWCYFCIHYSGNSNIFEITPDNCFIDDMSKVTAGEHRGTLTIKYSS
ncbi:MAG: hypothetical protein IJ689_07070 [Alphaproteobacteria bacterium]|nr:hypothetical protein [Alphaproteobacteria bacterium]